MNTSLRRLCIFTGSREGKNPIYGQAAELMASEMLQRQIDLVYGGGTIGLMGKIAKAIYSGGGNVLGVIPKAFIAAETHGDLIGETIVVETMHQRKLTMYENADAFVALPGGFGTLDELIEIITWGQLGIHSKPVGLLNINGFFDLLLRWVEHSHNEGFISDEAQRILIVSNEPKQLLDKLQQYKQCPSNFVWNNSSASTKTEGYGSTKF